MLIGEGAHCTPHRPSRDRVRSPFPDAEIHRMQLPISLKFTCQRSPSVPDMVIKTKPPQRSRAKGSNATETCTAPSQVQFRRSISFAHQMRSVPVHCAKKKRVGCWCILRAVVKTGTIGKIGQEGEWHFAKTGSFWRLRRVGRDVKMRDKSGGGTGARPRRSSSCQSLRVSNCPPVVIAHSLTKSTLPSDFHGGIFLESLSRNGGSRSKEICTSIS